ncbi:endonuclease/exonuclease/phosphatase family protein [Microlunatus soli]|uniref:Metal-dependent hydrolase, endonuclease/exonuclease/phosphatase family n=1 Tax=Microlunatus soli TaxID=630515 RepID=A0A1H1ZCF2_9ACTN|nr:endonuclease/exonuclease/phosphatase family protein [Microlunatus soli]SDT30876.1 Metal-dependent hydrolase, endonuclease/exonuclease/phosphatase family [Microlunatus soli]
MPRRILSTVLLTALTVTTALSAASPTADASTGPSRVVDVMTFNIHHAAGTDDVLSLDRIASVITSSGADIIGLQEVDNHYSERSEWTDEAAELAERTGFHVVFGANIDNDPPAGSTDRIQYGTAILSRYPIVASDNTHLFRSPDQEQRGLLHATIDVRGRQLDFYNTHLSASSQLDRQQQAEQIVDLIGSDDPAILTGDLNAEPDDPELKPLTTAYIDSWTAAGKGDGWTHPSEAPTKRIDFILGTDAVNPVRTRVLDNTPEASDHLPVISRIVLG